MKIRAREGGDVVEINDEGARILINAGIYDAADETPVLLSTSVAALTTESLPARTKKAR